MQKMFNRKIVSFLKEWSVKPGRKPLVLRGARQVGKTSAALLFAKDRFRNTVHINLDKSDHLKLFREDLSIEDFEKIIQIKFHQRLIDGQTLVFIDEIQNAPSLIKLLRFFYEERPHLHVIAAGSLLEAFIEKLGFSLPVGRVEYAYLYPLDFFEYLEAKHEDDLLALLQSVSWNDRIPDGVHQQALAHFHQYVMIGGMPEIVRSFLEEKDMTRVRSISSGLATAYAEDLYKYATQAEVKYLSFVLENAALFAGTTVTYEKFAGSSFRSREMSRAFSVLEKVMMLYQVPATKSGRLPLVGQGKRPKKLIFLDVGLVNYQMGIHDQYLHIKGLNDFYRGRIAEQIVGQNILAQFIDAKAYLYYWSKDKSLGNAEIDFCLVHQGKILGIEVKSGCSQKAKSFFSFSREVKDGICVRFYSGPLSQETKTLGKKSIMLKSVPFYLLPRVMDIPV